MQSQYIAIDKCHSGHIWYRPNSKKRVLVFDHRNINHQKRKKHFG